MKNIRCAIYTRTAAANAGRIAAQREAVEAHLAAGGMVALPERYDDDGASGNTADRPALARLLADAAAGKIDRVVVERYDRLARDGAVFAEVVDAFRRHGVEIVSATEPIAPAMASLAGGKAGTQ